MGGRCQAGLRGRRVAGSPAGSQLRARALFSDLAPCISFAVTFRSLISSGGPPPALLCARLLPLSKSEGDRQASPEHHGTGGRLGLRGCPDCTTPY